MSSFWTLLPTDPIDEDRPTPPLLLNLLTASIYANIPILDRRSVSSRHALDHHAGQGAYSIVEIGMLNDQRPVAVKDSLALSKKRMEVRNEEDFKRHIVQLTTEVRILSHHKLKDHRSIINATGIATAHLHREPSFAVMLEYAEFGALSSFLKGHNNVSLVQRIELGWQVSCGLDAVHQLLICHGDVKTDNVLVCKEGESWVAKICDFGQSILPLDPDARGGVDAPRGTPLLNAPEIRKRGVNSPPLLEIQAAMSTDIYSFGLLLWEVLNSGHSYLSCGWVPKDVMLSGIEAIEEFLDDLGCDALCDHARNFLQTLSLETLDYQRLMKVLHGALQDNPMARQPMSAIAYTLNPDETPIRQSAAAHPLDAYRFPQSWTDMSSFSQLQSMSFDKTLWPLEYYSFGIQERVVNELKTLAQSIEVSRESRSQAAMSLSEAYASGFGTVSNISESLEWLRVAASEESLLAANWYPRLCDAHFQARESTPHTDMAERLEKDLSAVKTEDYLQTRVRQFLRYKLEELLEDKTLLSSASGNTASFSIFNDETTHELGPVQVAALLGADDVLAEMLRDADITTIREDEFGAVHFACIGGQLSTLKLVLNKIRECPVTGIEGVTPLHLAIFFPPDQLEEAVDALISHSVNVKTESPFFHFDAHGIGLYGTAMSWAIISRNKTLVQKLLPHFDAHEDYLGEAVRCYYWEIVECLLNHYGGETPPRPIHGPFSHSIVHGRDRLLAIERTLDVLEKHGLFDSAILGLEELSILLISVQFEEDFHVLSQTISRCPPHSTKPEEVLDLPLLCDAITKSGHDERWKGVLNHLMDQYSLEELNEDINEFEGQGYLHFAVQGDAVVAARALLERGVNPNRVTTQAPYATPLQTFMVCCASAQMYFLLLEFGASLELRHPITGMTTLTHLISSGKYEPSLVKLISEQQNSSQIIKNNLNELLDLNLRDEKYLGEWLWDGFKFLLSQDSWRVYINDLDEHEANMLHRASFMLSSRCVRLLLEANALINLPLPSTGHGLLPFQIACLVGRAAWNHKDENDQETLRKRRDSIDVAMLLAQQHEAQGEEFLRGVTPLHVAHAMWADKEVSRLVGKGHNSKARARWPGFSHDMTPQDLREALFEEEMQQLTESRYYQWVYQAHMPKPDR